MLVEIKVPSPGESITEVQIARWLKSDGDYVKRDEELCEIDSDKATLTVASEADGVLKQLVREGDAVKVGDIICTVDTSAAPVVPAPVKAPEKKEPAVSPAAEPPARSYAEGVPSVAARKMMEEKGIKEVKGTGRGGRITKADVIEAASDGNSRPEEIPAPGSRNQRREKMTMLRKKIAQRLVAVKNQTAMLTTFNEVDMSAVMSLRKQYKDAFKEKHGVGLGFMSLFTKAVTHALRIYPAVNAMIDGEEMVYNDYADIGIAVSTPKGLMVPVIRNAESLSLADIEKKILEMASRARDGKITIEEMTGGTFTITNGGVFGSMLSTPIINPPQSAILGMHNIVERPVAVNGKVEIRPVMYVALSYDHRIIDGRESVGFLVAVKQMLEEPVKMLYGGADPAGKLLDL